MSMNRSHFLRGLAALCLAAVTAAPALADPVRTYEVTVTNLTHQQQITPLLLATHRPDLALFRLGKAASGELRALAEDGNVAPLRGVLDGSPSVTATEAGNALLDPGKSVTFQIRGDALRDRLSVAAMLIPTNDAFVALDAVELPGPGQGDVVHRQFARAYDAGTEVNDELCSSIPGPFFAECGGSGGGARVGGGEGFVHPHRGIHGVGQLIAADRDWRGPVAEVRVRTLR